VRGIPRRAWHFIRGVELSAPHVLPKSGSRRLSAGFLGRSPNGCNATGKGLKQRTRQRRAGQRRRYTLCSNGQLDRNIRGRLAGRGLGLLAPFGFFGVFAAKVLEEGVKAACFSLRFLRARWYEHALKEEQSATDEAKPREERENEPQGSFAV
jgi:hypothetical protein